MPRSKIRRHPATTAEVRADPCLGVAFHRVRRLLLLTLGWRAATPAADERARVTKEVVLLHVEVVKAERALAK